MKRILCSMILCFVCFTAAAALGQTELDTGVGEYSRLIYSDKTEHFLAIETLPVTIDGLSARFAARGLTLLLPSVLPDGFAKDAVPETSVVIKSEMIDVLSANMRGEPNWVEIVDGREYGYWTIPAEAFSGFSEAQWVYRSDSGEQWFTITARVLLAHKAKTFTRFLLFDYPVPGFYSDTLENKGTNSANMPYHWRSVELISPSDFAKVNGVAIQEIALYQISSGNLDMDELLQIAEGMKVQ